MRAATDLIRQTMGPLGHRTIGIDENGHQVEIGDARAVAALFRPDDPRDRLGAGYVADLVREVHAEAGGHAATAAVLAQALVDGAAAALRAGATPIALSRGIRQGVDLATQRLLELATPIESVQSLQQALTVTSRDSQIAEMIAAAMDKVGRDGVIRVEESNTVSLALELTEGLRLDAGYISPKFITDTEFSEVVLHDPYVLVAAASLTTVAPLLPLLEKVMQSGKPLLVVAEDIAGEALATLVVNKVKETFASAAVKLTDRAGREDLAIVTGARVVPSEAALADLPLEALGRARTVVVTAGETAVIEGGGDTDQIERHVGRLQSAVTGARHDSERLAYQTRIAKVAGGVAVLRIGAHNDIALKARVATAERALRSARLMIQDGVVPGGGIGLRQVSEWLAAAHPTQPGAKIVAQALLEPMAQLLENAELPATAYGFDALTGRTGSMAELGIMDSAGALRAALDAAARVTHRFLLTA